MDGADAAEGDLPMNEKDVIIYGAGRLGLLFGIKLQSVGLDVGFVSNSKNAYQEIRVSNNGNLERILGSNMIDIRQPGETPFSLKENGTLILATKTYSLNEIICSKNFLEETAKPGVSVLLLQNGIDPDIRVKQDTYHFSHRDVPVYGILVFGYSDLVPDGNSLNLNYNIGKIAVGSIYDSLTKLGHCMEISSLFPNYQLIPNEYDYRKKRFIKAVMNSANSVSAIFSSKIGDLLRNPVQDMLLFSKVDESIAISDAAGYKISGEDAKGQAKWIYETTVYGHYSSMALDFNDALNSDRELRTEINDLDLRFSWYAGLFHVKSSLNDFFGKLIIDITNLSNFNAAGRNASKSLLQSYNTMFPTAISVSEAINAMKSELKKAAVGLELKLQTEDCLNGH